MVIAKRIVLTFIVAVVLMINLLLFDFAAKLIKISE